MPRLRKIAKITAASFAAIALISGCGYTSFSSSSIARPESTSGQNSGNNSSATLDKQKSNPAGSNSQTLPQKSSPANKTAPEQGSNSALDLNNATPDLCAATDIKWQVKYSESTAGKQHFLLSGKSLSKKTCRLLGIRMVFENNSKQIGPLYSMRTSGENPLSIDMPSGSSVQAEISFINPGIFDDCDQRTSDFLVLSDSNKKVAANLPLKVGFCLNHNTVEVGTFSLSK